MSSLSPTTDTEDGDGRRWKQKTGALDACADVSVHACHHVGRETLAKHVRKLPGCECTAYFKHKLCPLAEGSGRQLCAVARFYALACLQPKELDGWIVTGHRFGPRAGAKLRGIGPPRKEAGWQNTVG